jgi:hypothetical protein
MSDLIASIGYFSGINNVDESVRLIPQQINNSFKTTYSLREARNVEIDNTFMLSSRKGSTLRLSGVDIHSGWSNGKVAFFVDGTVLYKLNWNGTAYSSTALLTGLSRGTRMSYAEVNNRVYMTNGTYIGYYSNESMNNLSTPTENYKMSLPAGKFITYMKGQLFVAKGKVLYIADALCDHFDIRTGFRVFSNDITMLKSIDDGIYAADGNVWFLSVVGDENQLKKSSVLDTDVIPYTDVIINGKDIGEGVSEDFLMWVSTKGICIGDSKGSVKMPTLGKYNMPGKVIGTAMIRNNNGNVHYIAALK